MPIEIQGGVSIGGGINIAVVQGNVDPNLNTGTDVNWTNGTIFDTWTSSSSATTDGTNSVVTVWQMFYAHASLKLTSGKAGLRIGTHTNGTNSWTWGYAVSSADNTQSSFGSVTNIGSQSTSYVSGGTYTANYSTNITIPANRYFLIGRRTGPFYYAARTLNENRTAIIGSTRYVTVINKIWRGGSTDSFSIPSQLGGAGTYTETSNLSQVAGFLFDIV